MKATAINPAAQAALDRLNTPSRLSGNGLETLDQGDFPAPANHPADLSGPAGTGRQQGNAGADGAVLLARGDHRKLGPAGRDLDQARPADCGPGGCRAACPLRLPPSNPDHFSTRGSKAHVFLHLPQRSAQCRNRSARHRPQYRQCRNRGLQEKARRSLPIWSPPARPPIRAARRGIGATVSAIHAGFRARPARTDRSQS